MRRLTQTVKKFIKVPGYIIYLKKSDTCSSEDNTENILFMTATMCLVIQSCLTLCDPMKCSSPGSSVLGISQARILEWGAISYSRGSSLSISTQGWNQYLLCFLPWPADSLPLVPPWVHGVGKMMTKRQASFPKFYFCLLNT